MQRQITAKNWAVIWFFGGAIVGLFVALFFFLRPDMAGSWLRPMFIIGVINWLTFGIAIICNDGVSWEEVEKVPAAMPGLTNKQYFAQQEGRPR